MIAEVVRRGRTMVTVKVDQIAPEHDDADVVNAAMAAARETTSSLFGWAVEHTSDGVATVTLHTD